MLKAGDPPSRDGISWALAKIGKFNPGAVLDGADPNLRKWLSYIIGYGKDNFIKAEVEAICKKDPEVYFAASVLWQIVASWTNELTEY